MATMWATEPSLHPWFQGPSLKRKLSSDDRDSDSDSPASRSRTPATETTYEDDPLYPTPPSSATNTHGWDGQSASEHKTKRRRFTGIEKGFAKLHIDGTYPGIPGSHVYHASGLNVMAPEYPSYTVSYPQENTPDTTQGQQVDDRSFRVVEEEPSFSPQNSETYVLPAAVEEPESPNSDVADIRMKGTSWYEPERDRIVVTSLDSSSESGSDVGNDEQDADFLVNADKDISISAALLEHIKRSANFPYIPPIPGTRGDEKALILFQPPIRLSSTSTPGPAPVAQEQPESTSNINQMDPGRNRTPFQYMSFPSNISDPDPNAMDVEML